MIIIKSFDITFCHYFVLKNLSSFFFKSGKLQSIWIFLKRIFINAINVTSLYTMFCFIENMAMIRKKNNRSYYVIVKVELTFFVLNEICTYVVQLSYKNNSIIFQLMFLTERRFKKCFYNIQVQKKKSYFTTGTSN